MLEDTSQLPGAMVMGDDIPWWFFVAPKLGVKIAAVWFNFNSRFAFEIKGLFRGRSEIKLHDSAQDCSDAEFAKRMIGIQVVLCETMGCRWTRQIEASRAGVILCCGGSNVSSRESRRKDWFWSVLRIDHALAGGVTDGTFRFTVKTRVEGTKRLSKEGQFAKPRQDLRSVLKPAVTGSRTSPPEDPLPQEVGTQVCWVNEAVLSCAGLMQYGQGRVVDWPRVKTLFGGNYWVVRRLSMKERFICLDFPETLIEGASSETLELLSRGETIPLKARQGAAEIVKQFLDGLSGGERRRLGYSVSNEISPLEERLRSENKKRALSGVASAISEKRRKVDGSVLSGIVSGSRAEGEGLEGAETKVNRNLKAAKEDNAPIEYELWDEFLLEGLDPVVRQRNWRKSAEVLRKYAICIWRKRVTRSFLRWTKARFGSIKNTPSGIKESAMDCLRRAGGATWWDWNIGSSPFFWNWPEEFQEVMRSGLPPWIKTQLKNWKRRQPRVSDVEMRSKIREKLDVIRNRGYVEPGKVRSLISYFPVRKGAADVRMVYDGTKSGLNDSLWAPWFLLPTVDSLARCVVPGTFMADNDCGEMFLNFMLHESVKELCGIDLTPFYEEEEREGTTLWERWCRCAMGLKSSPFNSVHGISVGLETVFGNKDEEANVFRWNRVIVNCPGSETYDPSRPWIFKARKDGSLAADIQGYVDDHRETAPSKRECWQAAQRLSTVLAWLGLQDAARKRRGPSIRAGAWAGVVIWSADDCVIVTISQERFEKTRAMLQRICDEMEENDGWLSFKPLESNRGSLVYVGRAFPVLRPYLKGFHATLDSYRAGRDEEGWKLKSPPKKRVKRENYFEEGSECEVEANAKAQLFESERRNCEVELERLGGDGNTGNVDLKKVDVEGDPQKPPARVRAVPRLKWDLEAMLALFQGETPPRRILRFLRRIQVVYGFGDASGKGFGSCILIDGRIFWRGGQWTTLVGEHSSNYRELKNLVEALEGASNDGKLKNCELFMFTDNSTAERAYFKGSSTNRDLFELVLRLRVMESESGCSFYLIHVSGKRMIASGIDGLSRGDFNTGVMAGEKMLNFVPLHLSAVDRSSTLLNWIHGWVGVGSAGRKVSYLSPDSWPQIHPTGGCYIWSPPPAGANVAVEWLAKSIHKRPFSLHVFVVPRLMSAWYYKVLLKATDVVFNIPSGSSPMWDSLQYEPLTLAIYFPLSAKSPWRHKGTSHLDSLSKSMPGVWKNDFGRAGIVLRELVLRSWGMAQLQWSLVP